MLIREFHPRTGRPLGRRRLAVKAERPVQTSPLAAVAPVEPFRPRARPWVSFHRSVDQVCSLQSQAFETLRRKIDGWQAAVQPNARATRRRHQWEGAWVSCWKVAAAGCDEV
jgi:hypothetical protein